MRSNTGPFTLRAPLRLTWKQVYRQFGADPAKTSNNQTVQDFRYKLLRELKKIKLAWPELNYATESESNGVCQPCLRLAVLIVRGHTDPR